MKIDEELGFDGIWYDGKLLPVYRFVFFFEGRMRIVPFSTQFRWGLSHEKHPVYMVVLRKGTSPTTTEASPWNHVFFHWIWRFNQIKRGNQPLHHKWWWMHVNAKGIIPSMAFNLVWILMWIIRKHQHIAIGPIRHVDGWASGGFKHDSYFQLFPMGWWPQ